MGRFHRHDDGTEHSHDHPHDHDHRHDDAHPHDHDHSAMSDKVVTPPTTLSDAGGETGGTGGSGRAGVAVSEHGDLTAYETGAERVMVLERIFDENDRAAETNRRRLDDAGVIGINVMSSPGAGKTSILAKTLAALQDSVRVGVVEGDIETSIDADRLAGFGAQISLLNTSNGFGGECHLDAPMVAKALDALDLESLELLFVENVGNLVCPAEFDVGTHHRAMVYSITEGEEKPLKYPVMFRACELVLVNKADLLPHLDADLDLFLANLRQVNPSAETIVLSARTGEGLEDWLSWLRRRLPSG